MKKFLYGLIVCLVFSVGLSANAQNLSANNPSIDIKAQASPKSIDNLVGHFDNEIKMVFSDIDGTIIKFNKEDRNAPVSENLKLIIQKLQENNIPFVLVSGRAYKDVNNVYKKLGAKNVYIIANQGAEILDAKGNFIYRDAFTKSETEKIYNELTSFIKSKKLKSRIYVFADGNTYSTSKLPPPYIMPEYVVIRSLRDLGQNYSCVKVAIAEYNPSDLKLIQAHMKQIFPDYKIDLSADCYCDISTATTTKGNAVEKISKISGVDLKNIAVFGDAENDISMLSLVKKSGGLSVAVSNAMDTTKSNANYVTYSVADDGVAKAIEKILLNNSYLKKHKRACKH